MIVDTSPECDECSVVSFNYPIIARMGGLWGLGFGVTQNDD